MQRRINRRVFTVAGLGAMVGTKVTAAQTPPPASPIPAKEARYRVDLPASSLPPAPVAVGASGVTMSPGTTVEYPEGSAGQSIAIDHVLTGSYELETEGEFIHLDAFGDRADSDPDAVTAVSTGNTIVLLQNEAGQQITAGSEETRTVTVGIFSLQQGTNETTVEGTLEQEVLGGTILSELPPSGLTVTIVPAADAGGRDGALAEIPFSLDSGGAWVVVFLPLAGSATPIAMDD